MGRILIVDADPVMRRMLASCLRQEQHEIAEAPAVSDARQQITSKPFDVVYGDQQMPDGDGFDVLGAAREADPSLSVVFVTAVGAIDVGLESMRRGAFDFVSKPFQPEVVRATARRAIRFTALLRENVVLKETVTRLEGASGTHGDCDSMRVISEKIAIGVPANVPGKPWPCFDLSAFLDQTEKELIVRTLHSTGGAQAEAARRLGLSRSALAYKLTKYSIRGTIA
jgi:DNA-binding NtrC family response regulator